ncbi:SPOR domain-containing protein [Pseudoalteromonas galatheae]|uniref:SPOR domain-containing protein n=1 Tax=Pseudoalteromonas galatheae TaxID=579562 RepID=UPI0030D2B1FF
MQLIKRYFIMLSFVALSGCQSTRDESQPDTLQMKKQLSLLEQQVSTLQREVEQLRVLKQQVAKFEEVQEDLDVIAMQLSSTLTKQKDAELFTKQPEHVIEQETKLVKKQAKPEEIAEFAIQLASTTEYAKLRKTYEQLKDKLPQDFATSEVNIEQVDIQSTKYYRLKLGAFMDKALCIQRLPAAKTSGLQLLG